MCACDASDPSLKDAAYNRSVRNLSMTVSHIYRFFFQSHLILHLVECSNFIIQCRKVLCTWIFSPHRTQNYFIHYRLGSFNSKVWDV